MDVDVAPEAGSNPTAADLSPVGRAMLRLACGNDDARLTAVILVVVDRLSMRKAAAELKRLKGSTVNPSTISRWVEDVRSQITTAAEGAELDPRLLFRGPEGREAAESLLRQMDEDG